MLLFGLVVILALLAKAGLRRLRVPPLLAYLALGVLLRALDERFGLLGDHGRDVLGFLASLGVIALLFRVGLESDVPGLLRHLRSASLIWCGNIVLSAAAGYVAARYLLGFELVPSLVIATALTATSVGIPAQVWREADALGTDHGERFLDVAELDDMSGVVLMALLFAVLPVLRGGQAGSLGPALAREAGLFAARLIPFAAGCVLFSRYLERRYTRLIRRFEPEPDPMLIVVGTGVIIAALAGLLGFSVAIGAFLAGLAFSRDPKRVKVDASFTPLYDLLTPFFFVGVGLAIEPGLLTDALEPGAVLLAAAVIGKLAGTVGPALICAGWLGATALGVSMIPRAEITMLIMHRARAMGSDVAPPAAYAGMVAVSAVTCLLAPPILIRLLRTSEPEGGRGGKES
jgi:Kef-type K+ transport system membrane component KefB